MSLKGPYQSLSLSNLYPLKGEFAFKVTLRFKIIKFTRHESNIRAFTFGM